MKFNLKIACAAAMIAMGVGAQAAPFTIDSTSISTAGGLLAGVPDRVSGVKNSFRLGYLSNTTITDLTGNGISVNDTVSTIAGNSALSGDPTLPEGPATNNFAPVNPSGSAVNNAYFGSQWGITFDVTSPLLGTVESIIGGSPQLKYTSGVISVYLYSLLDPGLDLDPSSATTVHFMDVAITGSFNSADSHYLSGVVDFAGVAQAGTFGNILNSVDFGSGFYDLWLAGNTTTVQIDFNTDITVSDFDVVGPNEYLVKSFHDGSVVFATQAIPEPGSLALIGVALLGLVASRRRVAKAV